MFKRIKQKGFTLPELLICIVGVGVVALVIVGLCVLGHFIIKAW